MRNNVIEIDAPVVAASSSRAVRPVFPQTRSLAGFAFGDYNRTFLQSPGGEALNDAVNYGVRIIPAAVTAGQEYWHVIGVHHLAPEENQGKHCAFLDILDSTGQRVHNPALHVEWSWEGQQPNEASPPKAFDKPDSEPATNLDLYRGQHVRLAVSGDGCPSDVVENLHTDHHDEPGPQGETWNSAGHHSFYVVYQRIKKAAEPLITNGSGHEPGDETEPERPPAGQLRVRDKLGIDANRPIDPVTGAIAPQVADPTVIAGTGVGWVRLNFVLGAPWSSPLDQNRPQGLTWAETYQRIIAGLRDQGLKIYGLIGVEAMREDPGDRFREPIAGPLSNEWIGRYAETFTQIATLFKDDVEYVESFNEPDDWHGRRSNWIHPEWFALILQEIHTRVRRDPALRHLKLISGPLQGLDINGNAGADYLRRTYQAGKRFFGWGQPGVPFPFDGIGYHLYIAQNPTDLQAEIGAQYEQYMAGVRRVIREEEGAEKPIYLSEFGWQSSVTGEGRQAECLRAGAECMMKDPRVALGFWFCTQDFCEKFGLYRAGELSVANRKPVYDVCKALCVREIDVSVDEDSLLDNAVFVPSSAMADGEIVQPGQRFTQPWIMRNTGRKAWSVGYKLVWVGDKSLGAPPAIDLPACPPNQQVTIIIPFIAPSAPGIYKSTWRPCNAQEQLFGPSLQIGIKVVAPTSTTGGEPSTLPTTYPPPVGQEIALPAGADELARTVAATWNRYGGLLLAEANRLGIDPGIAVAVLATEASGQPFGPDGRMVIRFENHLFYHYWGKQNEALFRQHFDFNPTDRWKEHRWRSTPDATWQHCHSTQTGEWQIFEFARGLDERAAMLALAMGAPQIMGFNHTAIGYTSVQEMFNAFCDVRVQLTSLFRFMEVNDLVDVVRRGDFLTFAKIYNGPGQAEYYKSLIERYLAAYQTLRGTAPVRGGTARAVAEPSGPAAPLPQARMPQPPSPTSEPLAKADPELYKAWRHHIEHGFTNNQTMFSRILEAFMHPYWTTIWMYRILFGVGVAAFLFAAGLSAFAGKEGYALVFGTVGVVTMLSYFFNRPLQALEENLQFITWLGVIYNTYWTRLVYTQDLATFQQEAEKITNDTIAKIKELMDKHTERSSQRPGLR